jgi:hypothetical protein
MKTKRTLLTSSAIAVLVVSGAVCAFIRVGANPPAARDKPALSGGDVQRLLPRAINLSDATQADVLPPPVDRPLPAPQYRDAYRGQATRGELTEPVWISTRDTKHLCDPSAIHSGQSNNNHGSTLTPLLMNFRGLGKLPSSSACLADPNQCRASEIGRADTHSAVAKNFVVLTVNHEFAIYDKCGKLIFKSCIEDFLRLSGGDIKFVDPRVVYDPWNGRWVMTWQGNQPSQTRLFMVISDDADPRGDWYYYAFDASDNQPGFADNYDLGYGMRGVYMAGHERTNSALVEATFRSLDKAQIYNALPANMITDSFLTNEDGTKTRGPRVAQMQTGPTFDVAFVNARIEGGDKITLWKLFDPFGAHTLTKVDITVDAYEQPPAAVQPNGSTVDTGDCRPTNAVYTLGRLYMANQEKKLWSGTTIPRAGIHIYGLDTINDSLVFNRDFGGPGLDYFYGACAMDFSGNVVLNFARTGIVRFLEHRYAFLDTQNNSFFGSHLIKAGHANYGGENWGDYFQASLDWGDYQGLGSKQKLWMYGMYMTADQDEWGTWVGATARDANAGELSVAPVSNFNSVGPVGGPFSPTTKTYTLGNSGEVGYNYTVTGVPTWLTVSGNYGEVPAGAAVDVTLAIKSVVANTLPIGEYGATITFENCCAGGTTKTRNVRLRVTRR